MNNPLDPREHQRLSSAVTLSDMEVFLFPELMYSLLLANIMSPVVWRWKDDPWFAKLDKMTPYKRIQRVKQYIMDHFAFNLDLETWGLTTKERELARFREFIDEKALARSNALFGYEGDKYYFDIDIRTHFGLNDYSDNVIPYWKTETVEAMNAFVHKPGYDSGAGECVSLASLYATALFVVAGIPLEDIYLLATPLHSQDFVDIDDGILINNRRLVTKTMWFNGSALSAQARRALENERVTIVSHLTGHIHTLYEKATIDPEVYRKFRHKLRAFLRTDLSPEILGNFLRQHRDCQSCFVIRHTLHDVPHYVPIQRVFEYEHSSPYRLTDPNTREKLLHEIDQEEYTHTYCPEKMVFNDFEEFIEKNAISLDNPEDIEALKRHMKCSCPNAIHAIDALVQFCRVEPRLPDPERCRFVPPEPPLGLVPGLSREAIVERLEALREENELARLAFHAYRDLSRVEHAPFLDAALRRNPVCRAETADLPESDLVARVSGFPNASIYEGAGRLAQPDEVWNFRRGDGLERILLLACILRDRREKNPPASIRMTGGTATLLARDGEVLGSLPSAKRIGAETWDLTAFDDPAP